LHSLTQYINQDEEQYVAAAYLMRHLRLYADFLYNQLPIYPLILSGVLTLLPTESPFLLARLLSAALATGSIFVFFALARRLSEDALFGILATCLFASAPLMLLAFGWTRNDIMPIFFGLCGVWFFLRGVDDRNKDARNGAQFFLAGLLMALAVGSKITAAFIPACAILALLGRPKRLIPLVAGGALGSVPILYYAAATFDNFIYCNYTFHNTAPVQYYTDHGIPAEVLGFSGRARDTLIICMREPTLILAAIFIVFAIFSAWRERLSLNDIVRSLGARRIFIFCLAVASIPVVLLPTPASEAYVQPAVPYLLLSCAALYPLARKCIERRQLLIFGLVSVVVLSLQLGRYAIEAVQRLDPSKWTTAQVYDLSSLIRGKVEGGAVASAYPLLVLDAGGQIYREFATGVFFFRSADHLTPERVSQLNGISPSTIPMVFRAEPPPAILVSDTYVERPLLTWATDHCYNEIALNGWGGGPYVEAQWKPRLFVRPPDQSSCRKG